MKSPIFLLAIGLVVVAFGCVRNEQYIAAAVLGIPGALIMYIVELQQKR